MNFKYPEKILAINHYWLILSFRLILILLSVNLICFNKCLIISAEQQEEEAIIETIKFKDNAGIEHEEYAFRAPIKGYPNHVIKMYCANIKLRLYWNVFREEVKATRRTGKHLRRLARFTRHLFEDIRIVDKPFNAKQLSTIDEWFGAGLTDEDQKELEHATMDDDSTIEKPKPNNNNNNNNKLSNSLSIRKTVIKVKGMIKKYTPTVIVGIYTRWRTMWWLMMSCLFAKYYLWDPALDEFIKLQRSMVMYPEFQLVKLQEIDCKSVKFFRNLLDTCKILNPLMNIDFGQLNLDKMWQFKGDANR